jgi:hypothetical protein
MSKRTTTRDRGSRNSPHTHRNPCTRDIPDNLRTHDNLYSLSRRAGRHGWV